MLSKAIRRLNEGEKPMLHSDQGWQYQIQSYQNVLQEHKIVQSMSGKGNCLDNAVRENCFGLLKSECFYIQKFDNAEQPAMEMKEYIHCCNHDRARLKLKGQVLFCCTAFSPL